MIDTLPPIVGSGLSALTIVGVGVALWIRAGHIERTSQREHAASMTEILRLRDRVHELSNTIAGMVGAVGVLKEIVLDVLKREGVR